MEKLKFLGTGSAFNLSLDNNSAYYIYKDTFILLDCGDRVARKIINYNLLKDIKNVIVLITHLHADHISSLETLIDYIYLLRKDINCKIVYNYKKGLEEILKLQACFEYEIVESKDVTLFDVNVKTLDATHIDHSYSYLVTTKDFKFYYSGDTNSLNLEALEMLKNNQIDLMYHEVSYPNISVHTSLDELDQKIDKSLRNRVYLMHFSDFKLIEMAKNLGFQISEEEKF